MAFELWKRECFPKCDYILTTEIKGFVIQHFLVQSNIPHVGPVILILPKPSFCLTCIF